MPMSSDLKNILKFPTPQNGMASSRLSETTGSVFYINIYPYFLNHLVTFEYKSNIDGYNSLL